MLVKNTANAEAIVTIQNSKFINFTLTNDLELECWIINGCLFRDSIRNNKVGERKQNIIVSKSYGFALKIIELYKFLIDEKEYVISKQVLRSGTSIGTNIHEAVASESKKDFIHKLGVAVKETRETAYWLNLLKDSMYITIQKFSALIEDCNELTRILNSIILTTKQRYFPDIHNS